MKKHLVPIDSQIEEIKFPCKMINL